MKNKSLLRKLELLGYPLFEEETSLNVAETLAEVVESGNPRLWESFPFLLAKSCEKYYFNVETTEKYLKNMANKKYFRNLVAMSVALYEYLELDLPWAERLKKAAFFNEKSAKTFLVFFKEEKDLPKALNGLSSVRVATAFKRYFRPETQGLKEYADMKGEFDLEYSLSQVFSGKQKELFMKKLRSEKMTKTEREYYSRAVRKKVLALANADLHALAVKLATQSG